MKDALRHVAVAAILITTATPSDAQVNQPRTGRFTIGGNFITGVPTGEFADATDTSLGFSLVGYLNLTRFLRIRVDGGYVQYGSETRKVCMPNCRVVFDLNTSNGIGFGSIGPELVAPAGRIRPYVNVGVGGSDFFTDSHLDGVDDEHPIGNTTNFSDGTFAVIAGGGVYIPLHLKSSSPVAIDVGFRYHRNGTVKYLREGDIRDNADGTIFFVPRQTRADLFTVMVGMTIGIRR